MPHRHGRDLRRGRFSAPGRIYLITTVTHRRRALFADWRTGRLVVGEMRVLDEGGLVDSLAWVVMPDHLHWLLGLRGHPLRSVVNRVKSRSAIAINRRLRSRGRIWQKGFHDHALRREEDVPAAARYVVANPLRAGLVRRLGDYPLWDAVWL